MRFLQNHPSLQILAKTYSSCVASLTTITTTTTTSCHHQHRQSKIIDHCRSGELLLAIQQLNSRRANAFSNLPLLYASLLQTCTKHVSFTTGLQLHALVLKSGLETNNFIGNSLLALYFKLGTDFCLTRKVFDGLPCKDVVSWTSMITGYVKEDKPMESIQLFYEMVDFGMDPNGFTLSAVIKASSDLCDLRLGRCFHGSAMVRGFDSNHVVISALIDMYGKNHCLDDARQLFDELLVPDPICWTAVISGLTREDMYNEALEFFYLMQKKHGFLPDAFTFGSVVTACGNLGRLKQGRELHGRVITSGFSGNVVVESSLVDMYGKCGLVDQSQLVFDKMNVKNSVSESALLGGYCQNGDFKSVLRLFKGMEVADLYHFGTVLHACAGLSAVREGKEIHCQYIRKAGWPWVIVESALVDLYAKCGCIDYAYRVFLKMPEKNLITWNSMVRGFAQNGRGEAALRIFDEMVMNGIRPDYISFIAVLFACIHSGLLDQGRKYFASMTKEYGIEPGIEHYNCMVDLLGRAGLFEEAEELIKNSDCRDDSSLWAVLLGACTTGTESTTTERIAKKTMELEPDYHLSYIYLANVYKAVGRWEDALKIRALMEERGVKKTAGKSWIEANSSLRMNLQT